MQEDETVKQVPDPSSDRESDLHKVAAETLRQLVAADVMQEVERTRRAREQRRWTRRVGLASVAIAVGLGSVTWSVRALIEREVSTQLSLATADYSRLLRFETAYQEFVSLSLSVIDDEQETVEREVLEHVMDLLAEIAESPELLETRLAFPSHLARLVAAVAAVEVPTYMDRMDVLFREMLVGVPSSLQTVTLSLGRRVLGSPLPLAQQPDELMERLLFYTERSREFGYPENYVLIRSLLSFQEHGFERNEVTSELVRESQGLAEQDRQNLDQWLTVFLDPSLYMKEVTVEGKRLAERVEMLLEEYSELRPEEDTSTSPVDGWLEELGSLAGRASEELVSDASVYLERALGAELGSWARVGTIGGTLRQGSSEGRPVGGMLEPGRRYRLQGACDGSCLGLEILLVGEVVFDPDLDAEPDLPMLEFVAGTGPNPRVDVHMSVCGAGSCGYEIALLEELEP